LAVALHERLTANGVAANLIDGDIVRQGLCRDLGFSREDRAENVRRVSEVARLMADAGLYCIVALVSPYQDDRLAAAKIVGEPRFYEIFVDAPLDVCRSRDPKGLYKKADAGGLSAFTGVSDPYEPPLSPFLHLHTDSLSAEDCVGLLFAAVVNS
jgi:adenylyl-sulfate kinase